MTHDLSLAAVFALGVRPAPLCIPSSELASLSGSFDGNLSSSAVSGAAVDYHRGFVLHAAMLAFVAWADDFEPLIGAHSGRTGSSLQVNFRIAAF